MGEATAWGSVAVGVETEEVDVGTATSAEEGGGGEEEIDTSLEGETVVVSPDNGGQ